jgi:tetratricopeptide (TPR) repeat protein
MTQDSKKGFMKIRVEKGDFKQQDLKEKRRLLADRRAVLQQKQAKVHHAKAEKELENLDQGIGWINAQLQALEENSIDIPNGVLETKHSSTPVSASHPPQAYLELSIPGNGDCLYSAVALYVGQDQQQLRNQVADKLETKEYKPFLELASGQTAEAYIEGVRRRRGEWAGQAEIRALMSILQRPIIVIRPGQNAQDRVRSPDKRLGEDQYLGRGIPIPVKYNGHNHYDALVMIEDQSYPLKSSQNPKKGEDKQTSSPSALDYYKQGNELFNLKKYAEALVAFDAALAINPQYAVAHNNRGRVLATLGRHAEALTAYDAALAIDPQRAAAHRNRGVALHALGRLADALAAFDAALAIGPQHAVAHNNRGRVLATLGRYVEALTAHDASLAIDPQYAVAHCNRGVALSNLGRHAEALAAYDAALAIDPEEAVTHYNRGNALAALGQYNKAKNAYLAVLAIDEDHLQAKTEFQHVAGKSYESYKTEKMKELHIKLAAVASEIGMFKRNEKAQSMVRIDSQAEETPLPEHKKAQSTIKTDSQTEENNLLKIILGYATCPPEPEEEPSEKKEVKNPG